MSTHVHQSATFLTPLTASRQTVLHHRPNYYFSIFAVRQPSKPFLKSTTVLTPQETCLSAPSQFPKVSPEARWRKNKPPLNMKRFTRNYDLANSVGLKFFCLPFRNEDWRENSALASYTDKTERQTICLQRELSEKTKLPTACIKTPETTCKRGFLLSAECLTASTKEASNATVAWPTADSRLSLWKYSRTQICASLLAAGRIARDDLLSVCLGSRFRLQRRHASPVSNPLAKKSTTIALFK